VGILGVFARQPRQPHDRVAVDSGETFGLANPVAFDQMLKNGDSFCLRQTRVEQRRALAFREPRLTSIAVEQANVLVLAVAITDREVAGAALTMKHALRILAAKRVRSSMTVNHPGVVRRRTIRRKPQNNQGLARLQQFWDTTPISCKSYFTPGETRIGRSRREWWARSTQYQDRS
jgi:hypothetical protein